MFSLNHLQKRAGALIPVASSLALMSASSADAACTPMPANNVSAVCTGTTINQGAGAPGTSNGFSGYGSSLDTGMSIRVTAGSSVTGDDNGLQTGIGGSVVSEVGAQISGGLYGVQTTDQVWVNNHGSITGTTSAGIRATDAFVTNGVSGSISGRFGVLTMGAARVDNYGAITGAGNGNGIFATTDAVVTNYAGGQISGGGGVYASNSIWVINEGTITATAGLAVQGTLAFVINRAGGTMSGSDVGVSVGSGTIGNAGTISGTVTAGINSTGDLFVGNEATGVISSGTSGIHSSGAASISNFGSISGGVTGISLAASGSSVYNGGTISGGTAAITFTGSNNTLTLAPGSVISGTVLGGSSNRFELGGEGNATFDVSQLVFQYQGFSSFKKFGGSNWTLTGTSIYDGTVDVTSGTLSVDGDISGASSLTVVAGGRLGGNGIVGKTAIGGGELAPGNGIGALTVSAGLTMTAAAAYLVEVSGAASDKTIVGGTATITGKVSVDSLTRLSATTSYTIMTAGTLTGTFDSVMLTNNYARNARLSYVGNDVILTLDPGLLSPTLPGMPTINQRNVAAGIDRGLVNNTATPPGIDALFALSGNDLLHALTQVSGETATGVQQTTVDAMSQFMGVMTDPFAAGRTGAGASAIGFAADRDAFARTADGRKRSPAERDAYAMFAKAPPRVFADRWNVWAAGFGGSRTSDGNAVVGSGRTTGAIAGGAVGADYLLSPTTLAGFALAGGGTNFSVAGHGTGRSDLFQAGAFLRHDMAAAYITTAVAYGWQDVSTDRVLTLPASERLRASFDANAYSARIEGGHRWLLPALGRIGVTPYAAAQVTVFDLPAYAETAVGATGLALTYAAKRAAATRTELGLRGDTSYALNDAILTLRGRAAWAHDINTDRNISAAFQSLPGSSFVVNGARPASNTALTSAAAELAFANGLTFAATFEGEFSDVSRSYAGKGVARYAW
ncbi:autotransporter outer membrane beta-barrel domain-containing protein [Tardiphaga alba]|uniref:autotransporter outer membrane beta-barrel domain-containing protein n=1 Tax=Tardiphaga alba TaxID=340268 RepID=UPI001BA4578D|nr:autotransporter domain-containing protein [Tardiphaga alba]